MAVGCIEFASGLSSEDRLHSLVEPGFLLNPFSITVHRAALLKA